MNPFDLWDSATITEWVRLATDNILNNTERIAPSFAPLTPTRLERISRGSVRVKAIGRGKGPIADDATPPIYRPTLRFDQDAFSLMRLSEMTPVEESLRRQLEMNGTDAESVAQRDRAGADIITRVRAIAQRQETLSDYLIMQGVLTGQLQITAANPPGQLAMTNMIIDYEYPTGAITQAPTSFDQPGAKPVDVLRAMQQQVKNQTGRYGSEFWMSSEVINLILQHPDTVARFNYGGAIGQPPQVTEEMLKKLLFSPSSNQQFSPENPGPPSITFNVTDAGWFDESAGFGSDTFGIEYLDADKTRWIPKDTIICMTSSPAGDPFAVMYDGMVPVQTTWDDFTYQGPGSQTYWQLIPGNLTRHCRWEARRFPMILRPERICVNKVVF